MHLQMLKLDEIMKIYEEFRASTNSFQDGMRNHAGEIQQRMTIIEVVLCLL